MRVVALHHEEKKKNEMKKNALAQTPKVPFTELRLARLPTELDSNKT